ncbi:16S rRNA (uracil(1498)-N(3))-methyltransferase [Lentibacillus sp. CBA3610]|nr:16S rRNA (uracil(1498)-N(3))-methyltransferase [Lentibacillus sp. CBA3610]QKY69500.1 16S rRNA (uracil(1498)-N(3))-methyltransferase [Lentibacillus sp. CBA3610]
MQRYFVPAENWKDNQVIMTDDDAHHISRVMRSKPEDEIICNHPDGKAAICQITDITSDNVRAVISEWLDESAELPIDVTIAQGLPKSDKMEFVLKKGTELGAAAFIPVQADRSVVVWDHKKMEKKMNRYRKIVKEASEQSHRNKIPLIQQPVNGIKQLADENSQYDLKLFAYEEEAKTESFQSFGTLVSKMNSGDRVLIVIGPEGGFSEQEAALLKQREFMPVRLGPRILRTETAALYALASISYQFEELGCK